MGNEARGQRVDPRAATRLRVVAFGAVQDHPELEMTTRDLSAGGALCESRVPVPLGRSVRLRLDLTTDSGTLQPVALQAIVLRVEGSGPFTVAFHFVNPPERVRDLIRQFVFRSPQEA